MNQKAFHTRIAVALTACALAATPHVHAQVSLASVVDLAMRNSSQVRIAQANVQKAAAGLSESKDVYLPSAVLGSSLGYSYGFPVGQPSVYNVALQSLIYSFSQPDYIRSARASLESAQISLKDDQEQVALDTTTAYIQLDNDLQQIAALDEEKQFADKLVSIEQQRLQAGVDGRTELTRAELTSAQVDEKRMHLEDDADEMRQKISHLAGIPTAGLTTDRASVPAEPNFTDALDSNAIASNNSIRAAYLNAKSKTQIAFGDEKQNYRPQFGFGLEYNRYAEFNNYNEYYLRFQHNNFDVGVQITFPIFDASRRAKARESAADAARANVEANQAKEKVSEQVLVLNHGIRELKVQRRVAQLQSELAQEQLATVEAQLQGSGSGGSQPQVTPKDAALAHIEERERYEGALDAQMQLMRSELGLMRSLGEVANWVHSSVAATPQP
ncbi:TolC family protein [Silvibacterium sp.]|uniref:TolC family protein n=1 Tax=Silvibacterium sp. TaxID=1964179 RepID=UPI0039E4B308